MKSIKPDEQCEMCGYMSDAFGMKIPCKKSPQPVLFAEEGLLVDGIIVSPDWCPYPNRGKENDH